MLKYGLIGSGMMGQEHIRNIALIDGIEVAAIFDPDVEMRTAAAALVPDAELAMSLGALLARPDLDALVIASPNYLHAPQLEEIANTRHLPLLVEKPLYTEPADAALVERLIRDYPAPVWVAMEYRYMPPVARLLEDVMEVTGGVKSIVIREHSFSFVGIVG